MISSYRLLLLPVVALLFTGCAESDQEKASGKVDIRAINAIVDAPGVRFMIEERLLDTAAFKASIPNQQYDDLSYNFRFEVQLPDATEPRELATEFVDVERERDYVFVLDGSVSNPSMRVWESEERQWDESETTFELQFAHLNDSLGPVDVWFAPPGTTRVVGDEIGTMANGERIEATEFPEGDYRLFLTPAGDPQTVLFAAGRRTFQPATTDLVVLFDKDPSVTADVNVRMISGNGANIELVDTRFPPQVQFINAAFGSGNIDVAEEGEFNPPLVSNLAFGERTGDLDVAASTTAYSYTDAGNMGAVLLDVESANTPGQRFKRLLVGEPGDLSIINAGSERRPFSTSPRIAFTQAAANFENLDIYLLPAGEAPADNSPLTANTPFKSAGNPLAVAADDYEVTLTVAGEDTVVAGPVDVALAAGDVVEVIILDTADPNVAELLVYRYTP